MSDDKLQNAPQESPKEISDSDKEEQQAKQVAIGKNIVQAIGDKAKALLINAPGLGYAIGSFAVVLLIVAAYFGFRGIFVRVEQVIPTPTPWLPPPSAGEGELLILVAQFERLGGVEDRDPSGRIIEALQEALPDNLSHRVRLFEIPQAFSRGQLVEVRALSERLKATFTVWGSYDPAGTTVHFTVIPDREFALRNVGYQSGPPIDQPKEFDLYFSQRLPSEAVFFTEFTIGQLYYWDQDYTRALDLFTKAIEKGEEGQADDKALALAYMHRGLAELFPPIQLWPDAISDFETAIQKDSELIAAYNNLGFTNRLAGYYADAREAHLKAIDLAKQQERDIEIARALLGLGDVYYYTSSYQDAIKSYSDSFSIYQSQEDSLGQEVTQLGLVKTYLQLGELDKALELSFQVRENATQLNNKTEEGNALMMIGGVYYVRDNFPSAIESYTEALEIFTATGDRRGQANALEGLGDVKYFLDELGEALSYYKQALEIRQGLGEKVGQANALMGIATVYYVTSEFDEAISSYNEAFKIYEELGDLDGLAGVHSGLGDIYQAQGKYDQAASRYEKALGISKRTGDRLSEANTIRALGEIASVTGDYAKAIKRFKEAINIFEQIQNKIGLMNSYQSLGYAQLIQVQISGSPALLDSAVDNLKQSLEIAREIKNKLGEANSLGYLGEAEYLAGDYESAVANYKLALAVYRELHIRTNEGFTLDSLGNAQVKLRQFDEAIQSLSEALSIYEEIENEPGKAGAMNDLAFAYAEKGENLDEAERLANQALQFFSDFSPIAKGAVLDTLGWIYFKQGKLELAKETIKQAYELYPIPEIKAHLDEVVAAIGPK